MVRFHLKKGLNPDCDIMIDPIRAIDNKRLMKKIADLSEDLINLLKENLR